MLAVSLMIVCVIYEQLSRPIDRRLSRASHHTAVGAQFSMRLSQTAERMSDLLIPPLFSQSVSDLSEGMRASPFARVVRQRVSRTSAKPRS